MHIYISNTGEFMPNVSDSKKLSSLILILTSMSCFAIDKRVNIVYGDDDRIETYQASPEQQTLAMSTAGMIENSDLISVGEHFMIPPSRIGKTMNLCSDERFADQPTAVSCSGFLVGPDLLVTAGHCINKKDQCSKVSWIFDYKLNKKNKKADILVSKSNVYKCSEVIEAKLEMTSFKKVDYSLIKLDRVVDGRSSLKYRSKGRAKTGTELLVIGHPSGLPQKIAGGAEIVKNSDKNFFETNLDTFGGNSGSAVFNNKTGVVEGILVRGDKDYIKDEKCMRVNRVPMVKNNFKVGNEFVSRITDIKALKKRKKFLDLLSDKKFEEAIIEDASESFNLYDDQLNSGAHFAAKIGKSQLVEILFKSGKNLNSQNIDGKTPLHIAIQNKNYITAEKLLERNVNTLIVDNKGRMAKSYLSRFSLSLRKKIKRIQNKQQQNIDNEL